MSYPGSDGRLSRHSSFSPSAPTPPPVAAGLGFTAGARTWTERANALERALDDLKIQLARAKSDSALLRAQTVTAECTLEELRSTLETLMRDNAEMMAEEVAEGQDPSDVKSHALESQLATTKVGLAEARFERDVLEGEVRALRKQVMGRDGVETKLDGGEDEDDHHEQHYIDVAYLVGNVYQYGRLQVDSGLLVFAPEYSRRRTSDVAMGDRSMSSSRLEVSFAGHEEASVGFISSFSSVAGLLPLCSSFEVYRPSDHSVRRFIGFKEPLASTYSTATAVKQRKQAKDNAEGVTPSAADNVSSPFSRLSDPSHTLKPTHFESLLRFVPARYRSCDWMLLYSTTEHGISLHTFYTRVASRRPTLLAVRDTNDGAFGCFVATPWAPSHRYYGSGESFLFTAVPKFAVYKWSGQDSFFQFSTHNFLAIGGGGHFGLWIDADFLLGTSSETTTYQNPVLSAEMEFKVVALEAWTLVPPGHYD